MRSLPISLLAFSAAFLVSPAVTSPVYVLKACVCTPVDSSNSSHANLDTRAQHLANLSSFCAKIAGEPELWDSISSVERHSEHQLLKSDARKDGQSENKGQQYVCNAVSPTELTWTPRQGEVFLIVLVMSLVLWNLVKNVVGFVRGSIEYLFEPDGAIRLGEDVEKQHMMEAEDETFERTVTPAVSDL